LRGTLPDPSQFLDMDRAAARLCAAVMRGETIAIFGDYDVDGATASALLPAFFAAVEAKAIVYIPGPPARGLWPQRGGAAALEGAGCDGRRHRRFAAPPRTHPWASRPKRGSMSSVVDHHVGEPALPPAHAVINPNRLDETSPHTMLAAVGVRVPARRRASIARCAVPAGTHRGPSPI